MTRAGKGRELTQAEQIRHLQRCYNVLAHYVIKACERLGIPTKRRIPAKIKRKPRVSG